MGAVLSVKSCSFVKQKPHNGVCCLAWKSKGYFDLCCNSFPESWCGCHHRGTELVEALASSYLGPDYAQDNEIGEISFKDIDQVARTSFTLCMQHLFNTTSDLMQQLREDHHLKHGGRMQLGLFLEGVGLKLDNALAFWKAEFSQKVGYERFDKEYAYNIRHNYGKEGKRMDYTPYSCQKIILSTPGVGDHHGCPYRHFRKLYVVTICGMLHS